MKLPKRKPTRLKEYDYSTPGVYFITICTHKKYDISNIIGKFKAGVTRSVGNAFMHSENNTAQPIWQSSFHDHIIRGKRDYQKIWAYIDTNVLKWEKDCFYND